MTVKLWDLVVKIGEKDGKPIRKNIGCILEGENGPYMLLERTFNPAGVLGEKQSIMVSLFRPREESEGEHARKEAKTIE
jgi:hypothetical protein